MCRLCTPWRGGCGPNPGTGTGPERHCAKPCRHHPMTHWPVSGWRIFTPLRQKTMSVVEPMPSLWQQRRAKTHGGLAGTPCWCLHPHMPRRLILHPPFDLPNERCHVHRRMVRANVVSAFNSSAGTHRGVTCRGDRSFLQSGQTPIGVAKFWNRDTHAVHERQVQAAGAAVVVVTIQAIQHPSRLK
jgi:hypothetical protein